MDDIKRQIEQLETEVSGQEKIAIELEAESIELERELDEFTQRYDRIIEPIAIRLEAASAAIADVERHLRLKNLGYEQPVESLWNTPSSSTGSPLSDKELPFTRPPIRNKTDKRSSADRLKKLYRKLALRYHPDLARDTAERDRHNQLMAMINEAYATKDLDALLALENATPPDVDKQVQSNMPLSVLRLRRLQLTRDDLAQRIVELQSQRSDLFHGDMMGLKIEEKLASVKGRDLLREISADMEKEYARLMNQLNNLRRTL